MCPRGASICNRSTQRTVPGFDALFLDLMLVEPARGDGFGLGIEPDAVFTKAVQIAEERILVSGKREISDRYRNADVDTDHAAMGVACKLAGIVTVLGEDDRSVGKRIGIHQRKSLVEVFDALDAQHGSKDFGVADRHAGFDMVKDGGTEIKAFFKAGNRDAASVQSKRRAFRETFLDPADDRVVTGLVDKGAESGGFVIGRADFELFRELDDRGDQLIGYAFLRDDNDRSAMHVLSRATEGGVDDAAAYG